MFKVWNRLLSIKTWVVILTLIALNMCVFAVPEEQFDVEVDIGFKGYYKLVDSIPLTLEIHNSGEAFEGKVRVLVNTSRYDIEQYIAFTSDLNIDTNSTKKTSFEIKLPERLEFDELLKT